MEEEISPIAKDANPKSKKCKYFSVIILVLLTETIVILGYLVFFKREILEDILILNKTEKVQEFEEEDTSDIKEDEVEEESNNATDNLDEYKDWITYTNSEMGFQIRYPESFVYDGDEIEFSLVEQEHYNIGDVNCVFISGPVDNNEEAALSIGYDPVNSGPNNCFRSGVGGGEQYVREYNIQVGSDIFTSRKLTYIGEEGEQSYINYSSHLDNPNMDEDMYNYFAIQVEYYFENEGMYREIFEDILKTFEWL